VLYRSIFDLVRDFLRHAEMITITGKNSRFRNKEAMRMKEEEACREKGK
jgi:hypothetical protein